MLLSDLFTYSTGVRMYTLRTVMETLNTYSCFLVCHCLYPLFCVKTLGSFIKVPAGAP